MPYDSGVDTITSIRRARIVGRPPEEGLHAITIQSGKISAITPEDDGPIDEGSIDAHEAWVHPGFVDAHVHLVMSGLAARSLDLTGVHSRSDFEARIAQRHAELPPDAWLIANGWLESDWDGAAIPDQSWLAAAGERPTVCWKRDQHAVLVNRPVLELVLQKGAVPPGGEIVTDAEGRETGLLLESAAWQMVIPLIPTPSIQEQREATLEATRYLASKGVVAVGAMEYAQTTVEILDPIRNELAVAVLVTMLDRTLPLDAALAELQQVHNDDRLAVIGCKAFLDGTFGSRTAAMLQEWSNDPGNSGMLVELAQRGELNEWIERVLDAGLSPSMHAIGDRAARLALDAAEHSDRYAREHEMTRQLIRIEHCQMVHPDDHPRFAGRVASMQPLHVRDDGRTAEEKLGQERIEGFFPARALWEHGAILAFGSDWPIAPPDPIEAIRAAIDGCDHDGRSVIPHGTIDPATALAAHTTGARLALGMAPAAIEPGETADIVLLDTDPLTCNWAKSPPAVLATISSGRLTYDGTTQEAGT